MHLSLICEKLGCPVPAGKGDCKVLRIADPADADASSITFLSQPKYRDAVLSSAAPYVIVKAGDELPGKTLLIVPDPYVGFARAGQLFEDRTPAFADGRNGLAFVHPSAQVHQTAVIGPHSAIGRDVVIGEGTEIGAGVVVEKGVHIGIRCRIDANVVIRRQCVIHDNVIIQAGTVVGSEGFGNAREAGRWVRIPHFGNVIIENDAEIGANCTIDRGALGPTIIGRGVKVDNLVMIAHNVTVGEDTAIAAQSGISGSTRIGKRVILAGQTGFVGHIEVGDDAFVGAKAGVSKDVPAGGKITGYPARDFMTMRRIEAAQAQLPELIKEVRALRKRIEVLEKK